MYNRDSSDVRPGHFSSCPLIRRNREATYNQRDELFSQLTRYNVAMKEMNTKQIEQQGVQALRTYVEKKFGATAKIEDIRNKGNLGKKYGCDLILSVRNQRYYIELKSSLGKDLPTNIRFTHQTLAKMHKAGLLPEMIVAFVYNLQNTESVVFFW
jgi:hypothetical protein